MAKSKEWNGKFRPRRGLDQTGSTNGERADRAKAALLAYGEDSYFADGWHKDPCVMQDLINDLMHLNDRMRGADTGYKSFAAMLESARSNYEEER